MAYYYVKSGGTAAGAAIDTADGIYTSAKTATDSWATAFSATTEYFANFGAAAASAYGAPTDGDYIVFSDLHNAAYDNAGGIVVNSGGAADGAGLILVSVDDDNVGQYSPGASDVLNDTSDDFTFAFNGLIAGVDLGTGDDVFQLQNPRRWHIQDNTMKVSGATDNCFKLNQSSAFVTLTNVDINIGDAAAHLFETVSSGCRFIWNGGALTGTAPADLVGNVSGMGGNGGAYIEFNGVDLSIFQGALSVYSTAVATDNVLWLYKNCKLHASATLGTQVNALCRIEIYNSDDSTYHRFAIKDWMGQADNDDGVYVTADEAWYEGSTISSIKIVTTANASHVRPFVIELPAQYVDLGDTGSDVLSLECVSATSGLQDNDIAGFLVYPDAASTITPNWVTSGKTVGAGNYGIDPLSTSGSALDAGAFGAGDWTGEPGTPSFYKLEIDTTGDPGEATAASIRIEVYKPSLTIYISPQIRLA